MSTTKEAELAVPETVEIQLDDENQKLRRKSSTSTSSFEERAITDKQPTSVNAELEKHKVVTLPIRPPRGVALTFKTTSLDDPTFYSQSSLVSEKSPKTTARAQVQVRAQKKQTASKMTETERDPDGINDDIKVNFEEVFAEPEGTYSFGTIWGASFRVFTDTKLWCYRLLSAVCAVPCALGWAIHFACLGFAQIWCYTPALKSFSIQLIPISKVFALCAKSFIAPCFEAFGKLFSGIRIHRSTD